MFPSIFDENNCSRFCDGEIGARNAHAAEENCHRAGRARAIAGNLTLRAVGARL